MDDAAQSVTNQFAMLYFVEGSIGAGKSTVLRRLGQDLEVYPEKIVSSVLLEKF